MNFSVVIPTYNREKELKKCIDSIFEQSVLPSEVLIIDDGELSSEFIDKTRGICQNKEIGFVYYRKNHQKERRGLSESKNIALGLAKEDVIFILDDDVILDKNFFEEIMKVWENNEDKNLIGVGGIIKNNRKKVWLEKLYNSIFGLISKYKWDINEVGYQVWDEGIIKREKGYYVHGGVSSYRKSLVKKIGGFSTFNGGRTALEDVDFCLRAKNRDYYFIVEPKARALHKQSRVSREKEFQIGFKEGYNRCLIFRENCKKNLRNYLWFYWASIGWILRQFLVGHFNKGLGMIKGYFQYLIKKL